MRGPLIRSRIPASDRGTPLLYAADPRPSNGRVRGAAKRAGREAAGRARWWFSGSRRIVIAAKQLFELLVNRRVVGIESQRLAIMNDGLVESSRAANARARLMRLPRDFGSMANAASNAAIASSIFPCSRRTEPKLPRATVSRGSSSTACSNSARASSVFWSSEQQMGQFAMRAGIARGRFPVARRKCSRASSARPCRDQRHPQVGMNQRRIGFEFQRLAKLGDRFVEVAFHGKQPTQTVKRSKIDRPLLRPAVMGDRLVAPALSIESFGQAEFGFAVFRSTGQCVTPQRLVIAPKRRLPGGQGHQTRRSPGRHMRRASSVARPNRRPTARLPQASAM